MPDDSELKRARIEQILKSVDDRNKTAANLFKESNQFEFDVCKLILSGTAGAFFLYVSGISYLQHYDDATKVHPTLSCGVLICWAISLLAGIAHMLVWAKRLHVLGEQDMDKGAFILKELVLSGKDPEQIIKGIASDEISYSMNRKEKNKNYKYVAARSSYPQILIFAQIFFLFLGVVAALNLDTVSFFSGLIKAIPDCKFELSNTLPAFSGTKRSFVMAFMRFMAEWGVWDVIGLLGAVIPSILILGYLFPKKSVDNFYIDARRASVNATYPKVVRVELRNHTNESVYVLSRGFIFGNVINASPNAARNAATAVCEIKFEGRQVGVLSEIDTLIRPNQIISTWVPVSPVHTDQQIDNALNGRQIGILRLTFKKLSEKRNASIKLEIPI